jgi:outer membrane protein insertion porin family
MKIARILLLLAVVFLPVIAQAGNVQSISIKGNQRVESESIKSYLEFSEGKEFSEQNLNQSIKALFATGLYSDVNITQSNGNVLIEVVENPIISQVAFEGNDGIEDDKLIPEVTLKSRSIYTKAAVQDDVQRLANIYRKSGRFNAEIIPKVILKDQNRVDLIFEIDDYFFHL